MLQVERIFRGKNGKGTFYPAGFKIFDVNDFLNLKMELKRIMENMVELNQSSLEAVCGCGLPLPGLSTGLLRSIWELNW